VIAPRLSVALCASVPFFLAACCEQTGEWTSVSSQGVRVTLVTSDCGATTCATRRVYIGSWWKTDVLDVCDEPELKPAWSADGAVLQIAIPRGVPNSAIFVHSTASHGVKIVIVRY
jgi:hypothetical protein